MDGNTRSRKWGYRPWLQHGSEQKMKVADSKCLLVSDFHVWSPARMVVLWQNMNTPAGPVNLLTEYTRCHFNTLLACGCVIIYTPGRYIASIQGSVGKYKRACPAVTMALCWKVTVQGTLGDWVPPSLHAEKCFTLPCNFLFLTVLTVLRRAAAFMCKCVVLRSISYS